MEGSRLRVIFGIILIIVLSYQLVSAANMNPTMVNGYRSYIIPIDVQSLSSPYYGYVYNGYYYWNTTGAVYFYQDYSSNNDVVTVTSDAGYYGQYRPITATTSGSHRTTQFKIYLNTALLSSRTNFIQSTAAHEFGHAVGLNENDGVSYDCLMDKYRDRSVIKTPQADDIAAASMLWPK